MPFFSASKNTPPPGDTPPPKPDGVKEVLDVLSEGVLVLDVHRKILLTNKALSTLTRRIPSATLGLPLWEVLRHRELGNLVDRAFLCRAEETMELSFPGEQERLFVVRASPLGADVVLTFFEITPIRRLENMRKDFVANVSHELKTPLTALRAALETLLDGALEDAAHARDFLRTAQEETERLQRLIEDLLTLSQLERPGGIAPHTHCVLQEVARRVVNALTPLAEKARVSLILEIPDTPLRVAMTPQEMTQILINLLENAIKFNRTDGSVTLGVHARDGSPCIEVTDTGVGIAPDDLPRIFERFYRADKSHSGERPGTGLGLAIVKHTVENHQGTVRVESTVGEGSRFIIQFPSASPG